MKPEFPLILELKHNYLDLVPDEDAVKSASAYGILYGKGNGICFDSNNRKWRLTLTSSKIKNNTFTKLLAATFYNPTVETVALWEPIGNYEMDELKKMVINCIENDDDVLTQFIEVDEFSDKVSQCNTLQEVYNTIDISINGLEEDY